MTVNTNKNTWDKENMRTVSCRLRKEEAEEFKKYAEYLGTSTHALLSEYVRKCLALNEKVAPTERNNSLAMQNRIQLLERKVKVAEQAVKQARTRAEHAEQLVDAWLRSADEK